MLYDSLGFNHQILLDLPFREAYGAITQDVAKPHHPVSLVNTPTWAQIAASGLGVLLLNGTNEYLQGLGADTTHLDFTTGDYSLSCWLRWKTGGDDDQTIMGRFLVSNNGWELYLYTNQILTLRHHHAAGATTRSACYSMAWPRNVWTFMGVSRAGNSAIFYRDGVAITTICSAGGLLDAETCNQNFRVGCTPIGANWLKADVWRPRIWDKALTADEWKIIYELEKRWF